MTPVYTAAGEIIDGSQCASSEECHWNANGAPLGAGISSVVPVPFQCTCGSSSLQWVSIMQMISGLTLEYHWMIAPVQWYPNVPTASGLEVSRSCHSQACDPLCMQLVWRGLVQL